MDSVWLTTLTPQLTILKSHDLSVVTDLCELAWECLSKTLSGNVFNTVAQKLQVPRSTIEDVVNSLTFLYFQIFKSQLSDDQFFEALATLQLNNDILKVIYGSYVNHEKDLKDVLQGNGVCSAQFIGLEWRLQSVLASRSRRGGLEPSVLLKLDLKKSGFPESIALVSDIPNIVRFSEMVEQALAESRTQNSRRVHRAVS